MEKLEDYREKWEALDLKKNLMSEAVQLEAVRRDGYSLRYCVNASEAVQLEAVKRDAYALRYCEFFSK